MRHRPFSKFQIHSFLAFHADICSIIYLAIFFVKCVYDLNAIQGASNNQGKIVGLGACYSLLSANQLHAPNEVINPFKYECCKTDWRQIYVNIFKVLCNSI